MQRITLTASFWSVFQDTAQVCFFDTNLQDWGSSYHSSKFNLFSMNIAVPAFRDVIDVPLVVRKFHRSRKEVWVSWILPRVFHCLTLIHGVCLFIFLLTGEEGAWHWGWCEACYFELWWTGNITIFIFLDISILSVIWCIRLLKNIVKEIKFCVE